MRAHRTIVVGICDSGIHPSRSDLVQCVQRWRAWDTEGTPLPEAAAAPCFGPHGTAVASVLLGTGLGDAVAPLAPHAHLHLGIALDGGHVALRTLRAIDWLLERRLDVLLLPLGLDPQTPLYEPLLERAAEQGTLVVAPVGNVGPGYVTSPADARTVLSVGAHDERGRGAPYSGSCRDADGRYLFPHVLAPGRVVFAWDGGVRTTQGTSIAAAHVAGLAAHLLHACPDATPRHVKDALTATARHAARDAPASKGGLVDASAALAMLRAGDDAGTPETIGPRPSRHVDPRVRIVAACARAPIPLLLRASPCLHPECKPLGVVSDLLEQHGVVAVDLEAADSTGTFLGRFDPTNALRLTQVLGLELVQCVDTSPFGSPRAYRAS